MGFSGMRIAAHCGCNSVSFIKNLQKGGQRSLDIVNNEEVGVRIVNVWIAGGGRMEALCIAQDSKA